MPQTQVLFVEDSAGDALLTQQILTESALPVKLHIARDGEQALSMLADDRFHVDMMILDLSLPKLSGFEVLERNTKRDIPIVVFSASARQFDMDRSLALGAKQYVQKPLDMIGYRNAVLGMVRKWAMVQ